MNESVEEEKINESFVTLKAPRTVIGVHGNGSLSLVQVYYVMLTLYRSCCHGNHGAGGRDRGR